MDAVTTLEARAAETVRRLTGLQAVAIGDDERPLHDFDLLEADGSLVGALEVTEYRGRRLAGHRQLRSELEGLRLELPARQVRQGWKLWVDSTTRVRRAKVELDGALAAVERAGHTSVAKWDNVTAPELVRRIHEMGVRSGMAIGGPPRVILEMGNAGGGNIPEDTANVVIAEAVARKQMQLRAAADSGLAQRHLFTWVDPVACSAVASGLLCKELLVEATTCPVPDLVTHVWVATEWPPPRSDWTQLRDLHPDLSVEEAIAIHEEAGLDLFGIWDHWLNLGYLATCVWHADAGEGWSRSALLSSDVIFGLHTPWYEDFFARRATAAAREWESGPARAVKRTGSEAQAELHAVG